MNVMSLLLIAGGASFAVIWLLIYVPLVVKKPMSSKFWSPKLFITRTLLEPMDAGLTLILVGGGWIGITSSLGISAMIYNVLSGIGISMGVLIVKKFFAPKWEKEYEIEKDKLEKLPRI